MIKKMSTLLVILSLAALFGTTFSTPKNQAVTSDTVSFVAVVSPIRQAVQQTTQAGTGECGYYNNTGLLHRNGFDSPDYCNGQSNTFKSAIALDDNHPTPTNIVVTPTPEDDIPVITPVPDKEKDKKHCDKGSGNGSEGCDPGKNPDKGNDDEGQGKDKDKKDKKNK